MKNLYHTDLQASVAAAKGLQQGTALVVKRLEAENARLRERARLMRNAAWNAAVDRGIEQARELTATFGHEEAMRRFPECFRAHKKPSN